MIEKVIYKLNEINLQPQVNNMFREDFYQNYSYIMKCIPYFLTDIRHYFLCVQKQVLIVLAKIKNRNINDTKLLTLKITIVRQKGEKGLGL